MKIPSSFYLKRKRWTVIVEPPGEWDHPDLFGFTTFPSRRIEMRGDLGPRQMIETFLHEFLHAVDFEYDLKISHKLIYRLERPLRYMFDLMNKR